LDPIDAVSTLINQLPSSHPGKSGATINPKKTIAGPETEIGCVTIGGTPKYFVMTKFKLDFANGEYAGRPSDPATSAFQRLGLECNPPAENIPVRNLIFDKQIDQQIDPKDGRALVVWNEEETTVFFAKKRE
jgi:hypothetical protein